ncbi:hypothetical protein LguiA_024275 [Lonicera macranthoides]
MALNHHVFQLLRLSFNFTTPTDEVNCKVMALYRKKFPCNATSPRIAAPLYTVSRTINITPPLGGLAGESIRTETKHTEVGEIANCVGRKLTDEAYTWEAVYSGATVRGGVVPEKRERRDFVGKNEFFKDAHELFDEMYEHEWCD